MLMGAMQMDVIYKVVLGTASVLVAFPTIQAQVKQAHAAVLSMQAHSLGATHHVDCYGDCHHQCHNECYGDCYCATGTCMPKPTQTQSPAFSSNQYADWCGTSFSQDYTSFPCRSKDQELRQLYQRRDTESTRARLPID